MRILGNFADERQRLIASRRRDTKRPFHGQITNFAFYLIILESQTHGDEHRDSGSDSEWTTNISQRRMIVSARTVCAWSFFFFVFFVTCLFVSVSSTLAHKFDMCNCRVRANARAHTTAHCHSADSVYVRAVNSQNRYYNTFMLRLYCMHARLMVFPHSLVIRITQLFQTMCFFFVVQTTFSASCIPGHSLRVR